MMQVPTDSRILGYPSIAMVFFLLAALGGAALVVSIVTGPPHRPRRPATATHGPDGRRKRPVARVAAVTVRSSLRYAGWLGVALAAACSGQGSVEDRAAVQAALSFGTSASAAPASSRAGAADPGGPRGRRYRLLPAAASRAGPPESSAARGVEVFGKDAIVRLDRAHASSRPLRGGQGVTAAGCTANGDRPYDCVVKGG